MKFELFSKLIMMITNESRHASGLPSAFRPHPHRFSFCLGLAGGFFCFGMGDGVSGGLPTKVVSGRKFSLQLRLVHSINICPCSQIHPRHPPRTFPLGLLAPCMSRLARLMAERLKYQGNEPFRQSSPLFGERKGSSPQLLLASRGSADRRRQLLFSSAF